MNKEIKIFVAFFVCIYVWTTETSELFKTQLCRVLVFRTEVMIKLSVVCFSCGVFLGLDVALITKTVVENIRGKVGCCLL